MPSFVHLRLHSEYSIVDSTLRIADAVKLAARTISRVGDHRSQLTSSGSSSFTRRHGRRHQAGLRR